jgi:iron-sulfur cluster assembly accessory protein
MAIAVVMVNFLPNHHQALGFSFATTGVNRRPGALDRSTQLYSSPTDIDAPSAVDESFEGDDDDAIIQIKPKAMARLVELKQKRDSDPKSTVDPTSPLILRMGVRNGGCSGLSYIMDFSTEDEIQEEDEIDTYEKEGIKCVVDAKSLLYLYGLELDYSDDLIGGGFKFFNPNAEESCGCGSSFGV